MAETEFSLKEPEPFSQFYDHCHLTIFRYIFGMTGGPRQEVEDMTAEVFFRAWNKRRHFHGSERAAQGWLIVIARNLVFDAYRRRKAHPEVSLEEGWYAQQISQPESPENNLDRKEKLLVLYRIFQELPPEQREILVLRHILGWQVKQIAEQMNLSENNVSVMLHRAIRRIQQDWPEGDQE
jgi:RNA polymerase sigma-70 factor, ECF subfamily